MIGTGNRSRAVRFCLARPYGSSVPTSGSTAKEFVMLSALSRLMGYGERYDCKGRPVRRCAPRLESLDERAVPGSAAAGVLGTLMTGPTAQVGSLDTGVHA